jgi:hypothetical protein
MTTIIKQLDDNGITDKAIYSIEPKQALICYLEQTINNNFKTWEYFASNHKDITGREYNTKSRFINLIKELPSKKGYTYYDEQNNIAISAYAQ